MWRQIACVHSLDKRDILHPPRPHFRQAQVAVGGPLSKCAAQRHLEDRPLTPVRSMPLLIVAALAVAMPAVTVHANPVSEADAHSDADSPVIIVANETGNDEMREKPQQVQVLSTDDDFGSDVQSLVVTATAFNSLAAQTDSGPATAAWGDPLSPGMKIIAVSHDLIPLGLDHHAPVSIEGLPGKYRVLDKMNGRWSKRIDIYMGNDVTAAITWGRREVRIHW